MGRQRTRVVRADRARSFGTLKDWPDEALNFLFAHFRRKRLGAGLTLAELLIELKEKFGLAWNDSSLSRYYIFWEANLRRDEVRWSARIATFQRELLQVLQTVAKTLASIEAHQRAQFHRHPGRARKRVA